MIARLALLSALVVLVVASTRTEPLQVSEAQQVTLTPTRTPAAAPTASPTPTAVAKPAAIATATPTATVTAMPAATATPTATAQLTATATATPQLTATATSTATAQLTATATATAQLTATAPATATVTATSATPSATPTQQTPLPVPKQLTPIIFPTNTPTTGPSATRTTTTTITPTATRAVTVKPTITSTPTITPTAAPPLLAGLEVSSITRSSATITWTSNAPASSQVDYGVFAVDAAHSSLDPSLVTFHSVVLTGLTPGTTFRYRIRSVTANGGLGFSFENTFTTAPAGSGPEVASLAPRQVTASTATLGWATSTGTVAQVEYGTTSNYGLFTVLRVFTTPNQQLTLSNLQPGTRYHYRVKAWDATGALGASGDATFRTAAAGAAILIGDQTVQTERFTLPSGQAAAYEYVASQSGQASVVSLFVDAGTTSPVIRVALYSDQDGGPGAILSQGSAPGLLAGWINVSLPPVPVLESTRYWIAVLSPFGSGSLNLRQALVGGSSTTTAQTSLAAFPMRWTPGAPGARSPLSVYLQQLPPSVTLTGPADGSLVSGQVQLSAVVDDDAAVGSVQFLVDGAPVGSALNKAPYTVTWDSTGFNPQLPHIISARATDAMGRSSTSAIETVQVDNGPALASIAVNPGLTATSARISWSNDILADGQVEFGTTLAYGSLTPVDPRPEWRHEMQLTGLLPGSQYHYRVRSRDANGAAAVSADHVFYTQGP